jgi:hypothetical protein
LEKDTKKAGCRSEILQRVSSGRKNISFDIHPKSQDKIDNQRGTHREKRDVDEPGPDTGSGYAHPLTDRRTHSEYLPLDEVLQSVHASKIKKFNKTPYIKVSPESIFLVNLRFRSAGTAGSCGQISR